MASTELSEEEQWTHQGNTWGVPSSCFYCTCCLGRQISWDAEKHPNIRLTLEPKHSSTEQRKSQRDGVSDTWGYAWGWHESSKGCNAKGRGGTEVVHFWRKYPPCAHSYHSLCGQLLWRSRLEKHGDPVTNLGSWGHSVWCSKEPREKVSVLWVTSDDVGQKVCREIALFGVVQLFWTRHEIHAHMDESIARTSTLRKFAEFLFPVLTLTWLLTAKLTWV